MLVVAEETYWLQVQAGMKDLKWPPPEKNERWMVV
jgi:hypothetical protein